MTRAAYLIFLQSLLPPGQAWLFDNAAVFNQVLGVIAGELARVHARTDDLLNEADPRSTLEMLTDWERVAGLPDLCTGDLETLQERRQALVQRITSRGGQSKAYFYSLAEVLGYEIEINEYRPFITGISHCGDILNGGHDVRYHWRVRVLEPRLTYFRAGVSRCGEKLMSIRYAEDLECILRRVKPAHTNLIFAYEGD